MTVHFHSFVPSTLDLTQCSHISVLVFLSCTMDELMKLFRSWDMVYVFIDCMLDFKINNLIRSLQNKEILQSFLHSYSNLLLRQLQSFFRRILTVHPSWRIQKWKLKFNRKFSIEIKNFITRLKSVSDLTREFIYRFESTVKFLIVLVRTFLLRQFKVKGVLKYFCHVRMICWACFASKRGHCRPPSYRTRYRDNE